MNFRKMIFWRAPAAQLVDDACPGTANAALAALATQPLQEALNNVINLPPHNPLDAPTGLDAPLTDRQVPLATASTHARGLLNNPMLTAFFADNHFGLGRHNGANYRTQEALELGKHALVSRFQNTLAELVEQKQAKVDRLQDKLLETEGFCDTTTGRLRQAHTNLEREMTLLRAQVDSASEGKGWVLEALNQYQIGFGKGLREAIEFELLAD
jgi:hypothetical protein